MDLAIDLLICYNSATVERRKTGMAHFIQVSKLTGHITHGHGEVEIPSSIANYGPLGLESHWYILESRGWKYLGEGRFAKSIDGVEYWAMHTEIPPILPLDELP